MRSMTLEICGTSATTLSKCLQNPENIVFNCLSVPSLLTKLQIHLQWDSESIQEPQKTSILNRVPGAFHEQDVVK